MILFELLTGSRPYRAQDIRRLLSEIQNAKPPSPRALNGTVSKQLAAICLKCLAKEPAQRYSSARELADALGRILANDLADSSSDRWATRLLRGLLPWFHDASADDEETAPSREAAGSTSSLTYLEQRVVELDRMLVTSQAEHQLYRSLVEGLPLCVVRTDMDGRFVFANEFFCQTVGCPPQAIAGKTARDVLPPEIAARHQVDNARVIATGKVVESLEEHPAKIGLPKCFEVIKLPVRTFQGQIIGVQGIMFDVSAHASAEKVLRDATQAAEQANQAKNAFLANMSHEIRTPMNAVIGMTDLLLRKEQQHETRKMLTLILQSAESLLVIIDDILDFSKIEAGHVELRPRGFAIRELLDQVLATFSVQQSKKDIAVSLQVGPGVPPALVGDSQRLRQVLVNLIHNALKFTERGEVVVSVSVVDADGNRDLHSPPDAESRAVLDSATLKFAVRDTGIGIPADKQKKVFEPFEQADGSISRRYGGTGLGLAISRQLVRLMGGTISIESCVGQGSTFHFSIVLPVADPQLTNPPEGNTEPPSPNDRPQALRILVAEDHPINQEFALRALQAEGHFVTIANNGYEAVDAVQRDSFDVVLMDVQMPVLDGLAATARIRAWESARGRRVPILAMTAHAMSGDRDQCLAAGMDGYIVKPIRLDDLYREVQAAPRKLAARDAGLIEAPDQPCFDRSKLLQTAGGDVAFLGRMLAMFEEDYSKVRQQVQTALVAQDVSQLLSATHALKGVITNFHAQAAVVTAERLERHGRKGEFADALAVWNRLQSEVKDVQCALRQLITEHSQHQDGRK